jgi:O-antigen ligase
MVIRGNFLKNIIVVGIATILFGQLLFKIIAYYTGISGIFVVALVVLMGISLFLEIQKPKFKLLKIDLIFISFISYILFRMNISDIGTNINDGENIIVLFLLFAVLPYALGRLMLRNFNLQLNNIVFKIILIISIFLVIEYIKDPSLFQQDRIRLFEEGSSIGLDEISGATQHFAGSVFGGALSISLLQIIFNYRKYGHLLIIQQLPGIANYLTSLAGVILIGSKASMVCTLIITLVSLCYIGNFRKILQFLCFVAFFLILIMFNLSIERISVFYEFARFASTEVDLENVCFSGKEDGSVFVRIQYIYDSFGIWKDNLLLGAGPGAFGTLDCSIETNFGAHPHNIIFHLLSELGLIGFIFFLLLVFFAVRKVIPLEKSIQYNQFKILFYYSLMNAMFIETGYLSNFSLYFLIGILCCDFENTKSES